jgi:hypothetical protein
MNIKLEMNRITEKQIIGAVERLQIKDAGLDYLARIDTGARTTSLHAIDLEIEDDEGDYLKNVGKQATFTTINEQGKESILHKPISDITKVNNAQGIEYRYMVKMDIIWKEQRKRIDINLRDRSSMKYKLLIGRDWLSGDFLVDVEPGED